MTNTMVTEKMVEAGVEAMRYISPWDSYTSHQSADATRRKMVTAALSAALEQEQEAVGEDALTYATRLVTLMAKKHYPDGSPDWKPLPDVVGILTQIDNMVAGMVRKPALASPVATREDVIRECIAVAEALPPMRKISDAHVKATSPKDVATALSTLLEGGR